MGMQTNHNSGGEVQTMGNSGVGGENNGQSLPPVKTCVLNSDSKINT